MIGKYLARNGNIINIDGMSEYYLFGETHIILSGMIEDQLGAWDEMGNYKLNKVLNIEDKHEFDIVSSLDDNGTESYFFTIDQIKRMA